LELETRRLVLKPWRSSDGEAFHTIWGDPEVVFWGPTEDLAASKALLGEICKGCAAMPQGCGWFAVSPRGKAIVGNILLKHSESMPGDLEIGWHFNKASQGHGYATEAAKAVLTHGFAHLDVARIIALIMPTNAPSQRVANRLGMAVVGQTIHAGEPHDVWSIGPAN